MEINFDSIDSFFENGTSFPNLVNTFYSQKVENYNENPSDRNDKYENNDHAYDVVREFNEPKLRYWPMIYTHRERKKLLSVIFNNIFNMEPEEILNKSNRILKSINLQFKNTKEMIDTYFIFALLNVLTDGKVQIIKNISKNKFDLIMQDNFRIANVPLIIDKKVMSKINPDYFYIQIQIIFDIFQDKIDNMIKDKFYRFETLEDEALLICIQETSKKFASIENFEQILKNNFIPIFVMKFLDLSSIQNVDLNIPDNEINNIKMTIEYLKFKDDFKVLNFDFQNPSQSEYSAKLFFKTFFNLFFLKNSKEKMIERCVTLLSNKKNWVKANLFSEFSKLDTFLYLIHFSLYGNFNLKLKRKELFDDFSLRLFNNAKIPMIINQKILENYFFEETLPDSLFYQLQFIFDKIDSSSGPQKIVENILISQKKFQDIRLPPFKIISLKYGKQTIKNMMETKQTREKANEKCIKNDDDKNQNKESEEDENDIKSKETEKITINKEGEEDMDESLILTYKDRIISFWDNYSRKYKLSNGILLYDTDDTDLEDIRRNENNYEEAINKVITNTKEKKEEEIKEKLKNEEKEKRKKGKFKKRKGKKSETADDKFVEVHPENEYGLYKILYYNEIEDKWVFDQDAFDRFAEDSKIKSDNIRSPVICYLPADEYELMQLNCIFLNDFFPFLDFEEEEEEDVVEQIYVYPICEMTLAQINYKIKIPFDSEQETIKPIFLLVHCPKKKESIFRIDVIMLRIYVFLSLISDLKIELINGKTTYLQQESSVNVINVISHSIGAKKYKDENEQENEINDDFNENETEDKSSIECIYNGKKLMIKKHKMIYLFHKNYLEYEEGYFDKENMSSLKYLFEHYQDAVFNLIDIYNYSTFKNFLKLITKVSLKSSSTYSELLNNLQCIEASDISNRFFRFIYDELFSKNKLSLITCIDYLYKLYKWGYNEDEEIILDRLQKDLEDHTPQFCEFFKDIIKMKMNDKRLDMKKDSVTISDKLKNARNEYMEKVKEQFDQKQIWTNDDIENIKDGMVLLMKQMFFKITNEFEGNEDHFDMYQYHYHELESAINQCEKDVNELFKEHFKDMEQKNSTKIKKFEEESANFTLKETENVREIAVEVDIDGNLQSVIKQDF